MPESKQETRAYYQPTPDSVEGAPTALHMFHTTPLVMRRPHWHAQVEVNFVIGGWVHYAMANHDIRLEAGDLALFWGGLPHWMDDASEAPVYAGCHLPLVHFFRLRLDAEITHRLMAGATLLIRPTDAADLANFPRWDLYTRAGGAARARHAVDELLLRLERLKFERWELVGGRSVPAAPGASEPHSLRKIALMCDFITENFLAETDSAEIAAAAAIHPKYAMGLFKKATGMTLNDYVGLLRLSYAQARLLDADAGILDIAMQSGFGSLSAFNKSFRKLAGMSPSDFRRALNDDAPRPAWLA